MNVVVTLASANGPKPPEVGDVLKVQFFLDERVGSPADGWEVVAPPSTLWVQVGGVTISAFSVRVVPSDGNTTKLEADVMVHQPGPLTIGPLQLQNQVTKAVVDVPMLTITGAETLAGTKPAAEPPWILPPVRFGGWDWTTIGIVLAIFLAVAAVLGRFIYLRLREHLTRRLTHTERALHGLANLQKYMRSKKPLSLEEWKKFSFELAGILRRYADENYRMDTVDMTDREFLAELRAHSTAAPFVHLLAQILGRITEVRYGRKELDASVVPGLLLDAKKFVESTAVDLEAKPAGAAK